MASQDDRNGETVKFLTSSSPYSPSAKDPRLQRQRVSAGHCRHGTGNHPTGSTQPCILPGWLNRVPALIGWVGGYQVTLGVVWHVSFRSGETGCKLLYSGLLYLLASHTYAV